MHPALRHSRILAFSTLLWLCCSTVYGGKSIGIAKVSAQADPVKPLSTLDGPEILALESEDTTLLSARDLSPDVLASGLPFYTPFHQPTANLHPKDKQLHLRSSSYNLTGIGGYTIFSLPILVGELAELLDDIRIDLQGYDTDSSTSFYQHNSTKWSFSVIAANCTLHYATLQAIVLRYANLSIGTGSPSDITSTRVGVVLNSSTPVADVIILPCFTVDNSSYIPFSTFGHHSNISSAQPTEIVTISPSGSICSYELINQSAALSLFPAISETSPLLGRRSVETQVMAQVGRTMFAMSMRLWRNPDGLPVQVKVWAVTAVVTIGYCQMMFAILKRMLIRDFIGDAHTDQYIDERFQLDTAFYVIGRMVARLVMQTTKRDKAGNFVMLKLTTWKKLAGTLLSWLQEMDAIDNTWAMEGDIYGPEDGDEDDMYNGRFTHQQVIGRWELYIGDYDDS